MVIATLSRAFTRVFGSRNERMVKSYRKRVAAINAQEPRVRLLTDRELRDRAGQLRREIVGGSLGIAEALPEALAVAREVMDRFVGIRNIFDPERRFDPQRLPAEMQKTYQRVARQAAETPPVPAPGSDPVSVWQARGGVPGWLQVEVPVDLYQAVREVYPQSRPPFRARPFDVQLIGGMVLSEGRIAEMKTGEGKTIVAPLACYLACLEGLKCHVVTVNDYLVQRDRDWVFPFYFGLGLSVGAIHPYHMQPPELKQRAYDCDVVYGTNSEFGFDYLRDNMKLSVREQVQKRREFCIIDEVDSILIDEARTPLIISGPAHEDTPRYELADQVARHLIQRQRQWDADDHKVQEATRRIKGLEGDIRNSRDKDRASQMREEMKRLQADLPGLEAARDAHTRYYEVELDKKQSHLTHEGVAEAQKLANIGSFYVGQNMDFPHLLENALRAHAVYQRDKDYVVQNGEVIIVDEFTGRLMIGRQWSDGLHQAVEAKERVKIKQETQTLATVTIQNFFKLYRRLAGMTGTAITEATEFWSIYKLEVVCIPTNVPVIREDRDDLIFLSQKDKWDSILDEIKRSHDLGRPVLVGTTSVEKSEFLSQMLTRRHGIQHEVLNAKQHEREAHIVEHAGELGAVMIATNMAGRGTDIKLQPIDRAALIQHWQRRSLLPAEARADMEDDRLIDLYWKMQARAVLGLKPREADDLDPADARLRVLRRWAELHTFTDPDKARKMSQEDCLSALDKAAGFMLHRPSLFAHAEEMGGLHIVGTERHEARRIDNQLRGRAGRQGDRGSSRFFISLDDDLMKLFAGKTTLMALSKLGMKEGDAIEHRWITKSVERAQRKVEERNYEIRKNLLEYDEVMEHQRNAFYGIRQQVLEGRDVRLVMFDYIEDSVADAAANYLDKEYVPAQIAEWCRAELDVSVDSTRLYETDAVELERIVRREARAEAAQTIDVTIGEYMSTDIPAEDWDLKGLSAWAMSRFGVNLSQSQLKQMSPEDVKARLTEAAGEQIDHKPLAGLGRFLQPHFAQKQLAEWAKAKFGIELDPAELAALKPEQAVAFILDKANQAYARREVEYPVDFVLEMAFQAARQDMQWAARQLADWARRRYALELQPEELVKMTGSQIRDTLLAAADAWLRGGELEKSVDEAMARHRSDTAALVRWIGERWQQSVEESDLTDPATRRDVLLAKARETLRAELTQLERFVLLQVLDTCWKDHLYAMDQLKDSVGLRAYAEQDPRIVYKREGANLFQQMQKTVRDRVTELSFRARLTANVEARSVYHEESAEHAEAQSAVSSAGRASAAAAAGTAEQRADLDAAQRAGGGDGGEQDFANLSRKQRRAMAARHGEREEEAKKEPGGPRFKERKRRGR